MNHPCGWCGTPTPEAELVWEDELDDFVCQDCNNNLNVIKEIGQEAIDEEEGEGWKS